MNEGKCGVRRYANITKAKIDRMLEELRKQGYKVTGNNPWTIDTNNHGVVLQGTWHEATETLSVIVTAKKFYVPCGEIWKKIDPLINGLSAMDLEDSLSASSDGKCGRRCYPDITKVKIDKMLQALRDNGYDVVGENPWTVDTKKHGIVLRAFWDSEKNVLCIIVVEKGWLVPCKSIWDAIEPLIRNLSSMSEDEMV